LGQQPGGNPTLRLGGRQSVGFRAFKCTGLNSHFGRTAGQNITHPPKRQALSPRAYPSRHPGLREPVPRAIARCGSVIRR